MADYLACQSKYLVYNIKHRDAPKELLTEDEVEILTSPLIWQSTKSIMNALIKVQRNVISEAKT